MLELLNYFVEARKRLEDTKKLDANSKKVVELFSRFYKVTKDKIDFIKKASDDDKNYDILEAKIREQVKIIEDILDIENSEKILTENIIVVLNSLKQKVPAGVSEQPTEKLAGDITAEYQENISIADNFKKLRNLLNEEIQSIRGRNVAVR